MTLDKTQSNRGASQSEEHVEQLGEPHLEQLGEQDRGSLIVQLGEPAEVAEPGSQAAGETGPEAGAKTVRDSSPSPLIDREEAIARVGGDEGLLREIAQLFLDDYPRSLAELRAAAAHGDSRKVERSAHGLKGAVANFGAQRVVDAAAALERMGRAEELSGFAAALSALERSLSALHDELQAL